MIKKILMFLTKPFEIMGRLGVRHLDKFYEKILSNEKSLKWIAFILVLFVYVGINYTSNFVLFYAEDVKGKGLTAVYDETQYIVEGLPKGVDVTLRGKESLVRNVITNNTFSTYVDLAGLKEGEHLVDVKYDKIPSGISVEINPQTISITISKIEQKDGTVELELLNEDTLDEVVTLNNFTLSTKKVTIKGKQENLDNVVKVKAFLNLNDIKDVNHTINESSSYECVIPLYALDENGDKVNVQLDPYEVKVMFNASVPQKTVQLKPRLVGELEDNLAIRDIELTPSEVTLYAPQTVLDTFDSLSFDISLNKLNGVYEGEVQLVTPNDVTKLSESSIHFKLNTEKSFTKAFEQVKIGVQNLPSGLAIENVEELLANVSIKGVKEAIETYDEKELVLIVDLTKLTEGTHTIPIQILNKKSNLTYECPSDIQVKLVKTQTISNET